MDKIVVDFREKELNESYLTAIGGVIKYALEHMFPGSKTGMDVYGTPSQTSTFIDALKSERRYLDYYNRFGLTDPKTYSSKYKLDGAIQSFESATGVKWPFK